MINITTTSKKRRDQRRLYKAAGVKTGDTEIVKNSKVDNHKVMMLSDQNLSMKSFGIPYNMNARSEIIRKMLSGLTIKSPENLGKSIKD